jgi:DNA-binding transcriptional LysR family regulator
VELRQLRAFVAVAEFGHYRRAAASLNLTQPAITQRVQALESDLGVQLLRRNARGVRLTAAGEVLLGHARGLVQIEDRALAAITDHVAGIGGRLRLSYLTLWDAGLPPKIVAELRRRHPEIKLETTTGYSETNVQRLVSGDLDFAFIGVTVGERQGIAMRPLDRHEIVLVMAPSNRLSEMDRVPVSSLRGVPLISASPGVNGRLVRASLEWLEEGMGEAPNVIREEPPDQMAGALAQQGDAVALMTVHRAMLAATEGLVYRRLTPTPFIEYGVAYATSNPSPALANLLKIVEDVAGPALADLPVDGQLLGAQMARS